MLLIVPVDTPAQRDPPVIYFDLDLVLRDGKIPGEDVQRLLGNVLVTVRNAIQVANFELLGDRFNAGNAADGALGRTLL